MLLKNILKMTDNIKEHKTMNKNCIPLSELCCGECGIVEEICCNGSMKRRFCDLGMIKGTKIKKTAQNAHKDISIYLIRGAMIAIRSSDAVNINVIRVIS